jgi:hypothetical protein
MISRLLGLPNPAVVGPDNCFFLFNRAHHVMRPWMDEDGKFQWSVDVGVFTVGGTLVGLVLCKGLRKQSNASMNIGRVGCWLFIINLQIHILSTPMSH